MAVTQKLETTPALMKPEDLLTLKELCTRLKVRPSWVYKHVAKDRKNQLPVLRCDGFLRFEWPAVVAWLRSNNSS
jgi:hypothetical protein